ncbi:MAG: hypothetical protein REI78_02560 [Pedobacter sp.]|nr:hypothetical protein [Pedobacter sp.]MDQ8051874.1 hypothetical protein [Pedobacter sp.]
MMQSAFERFYGEAKGNRWFRYFTLFNRLALAIGFFGAGIQKIMGERFTSLSINHPMGNYLEALSHTGFYYNLIGVAQVLAALLLLIPRTALFGALLYFPIILNICLLSISVRFEGSLLTSPLMVLSNLYLLVWDYDRLKGIFRFERPGKITSNRFPFAFFGGGLIVVLLLVATLTTIFDIMPRNTQNDCMQQCDGSKNPKACQDFCDCIHENGKPLKTCLDNYHKAL